MMTTIHTTILYSLILVNRLTQANGQFLPAHANFEALRHLSRQFLPAHALCHACPYYLIYMYKRQRLLMIQIKAAPSN